jgi:4-hydroxybenzoate polyprenyltransferase
MLTTKLCFLTIFLNSILSVNTYINKTRLPIQPNQQNKINNFHNFHKLYEKKYYNDKWVSYNKLLRTQNCIPTFLLNFLGGWLTIPSYKLLLNKNFWFFSLITQLTMMNSMVINDLFDLKVDLINNNNRPLVNKQITIKEAKCLYISITTIIRFLSVCFFIKNYFFIYIYGINFLLFLYTPFLKKILLVKNLTCSSVVASTILMTSKSIVNNDTNNFIFSTINSNVNLINITSRFLFLSSFYIELLLDIKDQKGDEESNIITIPNYFGEKKTLNSLIIIFILNLLYQTNIFYKYKKYKLLIGFILSNSIFLNNLFTLRNKCVSDEKILDAVKHTTISLLIFIITITLPI